ncbi:MAG: MFS transporter [Aestuariivirga sp.]
MSIALAYDDTQARRNAVILAVAQALYGSAVTMLIVTAGLVGTELSTDPSWATLPVSAFVIGTALTTLPVSLLMRRIGRKAGFMIGSFAGMTGGLLGVYAIYQRSFVIFLAGAFLIGIYQASASYYRFAAADLASPAFRPKAISWVMTGGVVAALIGSGLVIATVDLLAPVIFAGSWAAMAAIALLSSAVLMALDIPREEDKTDAAPARPLLTIARQPRYIAAAAIGMLSYGIMMLVMTATPVAMIAHGFTVGDSSWVIQWHALAMFVPSFFTGHLITRFGVERIAVAGMLLLVGAAVAGLLGIHFGNFAVGLILLGLGWNFGFIGATTMLTGCYESSERNKAQGLNDFLIFGTTALASLSAGKLLHALGWNAVNYAVFPMVLVALAMIAWLIFQPRTVAQRG